MRRSNQRRNEISSLAHKLMERNIKITELHKEIRKLKEENSKLKTPLLVTQETEAAKENL